MKFNEIKVKIEKELSGVYLGKSIHQTKLELEFIFAFEKRPNSIQNFRIVRIIKQEKQPLINWKISGSTSVFQGERKEYSAQIYPNAR